MKRINRIAIPRRDHHNRTKLLPFFAASMVVAMISAGLSIVPTGSASAATQVVTNCNDSGSGSLRQAVAQAEAGDTIGFSLICPTITLTSGAIAVDVPLTITGPAPRVLTVSGNNAAGVFQVASGVTAEISGLWIEDGAALQGAGIYNQGNLTLSDGTVSGNNAAGDGTETEGGGIYNSGSLSLSDDTISNNSASAGSALTSGGGIFNSGTVTVAGGTISGNAASYGGGLASSGTLTVATSSLSDNTATAQAGGAIDSDGTLTITNSTFSNNSALTGGAVTSGGPMTLSNSTFTGNSSTGGGAVYTFGEESSSIEDSSLMDNSAADGSGGALLNSGSLDVSNGTVSENTGTWGGAVDNDGSLTFTDSTVSNNTATGGYGGAINNSGTLNFNESTLSSNTIAGGTQGGGAIWNGPDGNTFVFNSTLSGNAATGGAKGGGVYNSGTFLSGKSTYSGNTARHEVGGDIDNVGGSVNTQASIFANGTGKACEGLISSSGWNIDDDGSCGFTNATDISHSTTLDSTLGPLANNGGPTMTIALLPGSPAIGKVPAVDCVSTDQRGAPRPPPCDIGAYDTGGNPTITKIKPADGRIGEKVTIKGTNLGGATAVTFNGTSAVITTDTATKVTTKVPSGATTGPIRVTTSVGGTVTSSKSFKVT